MTARFWILLLLAATPIAARALPWTIKINTTDRGSNGLIEYEISRSPSFDASSLVDQGYSQDPILKGDLPGGLYYLHYRVSQTGSKPGPWSPPTELTLTNRESTTFLEPLPNARIESPNAKTSVLYRWQRVEGASQYLLEIKNLGSQKTITIKATNPFVTAQLNYGKWSAQVSTYVGKKLINTTAALVTTLEPTSQEGAEFIRPQNDDVITSLTKTLLEIKRAYVPLKTTLVIKNIGGNGKAPAQNIELSPTDTQFNLPPLKSGTYQLTVIDEFQQKNSIESNIVIRVEDDPLGSVSRGSKTYAEASLGFIAGTRYQTNQYTSPIRIPSKMGAMGPRISAAARNSYFDPYILELRFEALPTHFDIYRYYNRDSNSHNELLGSANLLYRLNWPETPNSMFLRAGLFLKRFHQVSEDAAIINQTTYYEVQDSPIRLEGFITGVDWDWLSMSRTWTSRFSLRLMFPLFSQASNVATGKPWPNPALEISATFKRKIGEFSYFTFSPEIKTERWLNSESDSALPRSEHYLVSAGLLLGLGLDL